MKFKLYLIAFLLVIIGIGLTRCSPGGETKLAEDKLNNQNYKISNSDGLAQDLQQINTNLAFSSSVSVFPLTQGAKPVSVAFQEDKKFKLTYSDGSFLVGFWEIEGNQLKLTFMGVAALFGIEFPTEESVQLWIEKILDTSSVPGNGEQVTPGITL